MNSKYFDAEWYCKQYGVKKRNAIKDYMQNAIALNRKPSEAFPQEDYLLISPDLVVKNINPLLHYEVYGKYEARGVNVRKEFKNEISINDLLKYVGQDNCNVHKSATIIIPVYNGYELFKECLDSLNKTLDCNTKVIIVNDNSTDSRISELLSLHNDYTLINNETNLGFVKSINKAMQMVDTDLAIWLNSDTVLPNNWLNRLLKPFNDNELLASATPFSNSAAGFSFPVFFENNEMYSDLETLNKAFNRMHAINNNIENVYTGTGFCMAISMKIYKEIGQLDEINFTKGYGEENDWCFRASKKGYIHKLVPNLFIQHKHGGSFSSKEKQELMDDHIEILNVKYPEIMKKDAEEFRYNDPFRPFRTLACIFLSEGNNELIIDIDLPTDSNSGTKYYLENRIKELVTSNKKVITLKYKQNTNIWVLYLEAINKNIKISFTDLSDLKKLFELIEIDKICINNLAYNTMIIENIKILYSLKQEYNFDLEYVFHDHLSVCPSLFLIDNYNLPCRIENCDECILNNRNTIIQIKDINEYRSAFRKLFSVVNKFTFFSEYTKALIEKVYKEVANGIVEEHKTLLAENHSLYKISRHRGINIAYVGAYSELKGSKYYDEVIYRLNKKYKVNSYVIGTYDYKNKKHRYLGNYDRNELGNILTNNNIDEVILPSCLNETYSYVAQELMELNVPIVVFYCGAPASRIIRDNYYYGEIAGECNSNSLLQACERLLKKIKKI